MFLPVVGALLVIWVMVAVLALAERRLTLERVTGQLSNTVLTLADFNELADLATGETIVRGSEQRTAAIWRALLQYPTASIWLEADGNVIGGQPPLAVIDAALLVEERRAAFIVYAALPQADALEDWRRGAWWRAAVLLLASIAFLGLTQLLTRALRERAAAELDAAAAAERAAQLSIYRAQLEETVAQRTSELKASHEQLKKELADRKAAEAALQEHDALLHAVTRGAAELLGAHSDEQAIASVLELMGRTVGVGRVHLCTIETGDVGHMAATLRYEWCAPGLQAVIDDPALRMVDMTANFPRSVGALLTGNLASFFVEEITGPLRGRLAEADMRSFLAIPVQVEGKLWGSLNFVDSTATRRSWSWAETDTLQTLAGLVGAAITRARFVKELADANMIVQNSPTILYRLRGEPSFPLIYVSHNITKFGHDAEALVGAADWSGRLMDAEDEARVGAAMARMLERGTSGAAIEFRLRTGDGGYRWVENRYTPVRDRDGRLIEIEGIIIDITERKAAEERIAHLARTDGLTGLANRATFIERLRQAYVSASRGSTPFAILYLDLDRFKLINDTLGHAVGDGLLREVAARLRRCTRENDVVARLGGDEFAILQMDMHEPANAGTLASAVLAAATRPYLIDGNELRVTSSVGICPFGPGTTGPDAMLAQADLALYRAKEEGRNCYRFHSDELDHEVLERVALSEDLRKALERDELEVFYQPQVELGSNCIVGLEALVRWHHPRRGLLGAREFIPAAEKTGVIVALGKWVLRQVCAQIGRWRAAGIEPPALTMNLSLAQLKNRRELVAEVVSALGQSRIEPSSINFSVTEAILAQATLMHNDVLMELRQLGVGIAIADFGSEYSSFTYLRTYRVNHLKVPQSFIDAAADDPERAATIRAIVGLARELGIEVIAQGVETERQHALLLAKELTVSAQGFYFSDALIADEVGLLLREGRIPIAATPNASVIRNTIGDRR